MPSITGQVEVNLTVRDPRRSAAWYIELLGMEELYNFASANGRMRYISLIEPKSGFVLCLAAHASNPGEPFDEVRTGLDHLEFLVTRHDELQEWAHRLDELGIVHSDVKNLSYTHDAMITFRDPDNIQLEFFWRASSRRDDASVDSDQ